MVDLFLKNIDVVYVENYFHNVVENKIEIHVENDFDSVKNVFDHLFEHGYVDCLTKDFKNGFEK